MVVATQHATSSNQTGQQTALQTLASQHGIELGFHDVFGNWNPATDLALTRLLTLLGIACDSPAAIAQSLEQTAERRWSQPLEPVQVVRESVPQLWITLRLPASRWGAELAWQLVEENGQTHAGHWYPQQEAQQVLEHTLADGRHFIQGQIPLPFLPPQGYHTLTLTLPDNQQPATCRLIRVPDTCYLPERLKYESGAWGPAIQLYSLKSERNWGMGDLTDLRHLLNWSAHQGAGFVGLNPVHELFPHNPHHISPYSPSSRQFYNSLYLDVEAVPEFARCAEAQALTASDDYRHALDQLRNSELVDYPWVNHLKRPVLEALYRQFIESELDQETARAQAFRRFVAEGGESLQRFALYQTLQEHFYQKDDSLWGWPVWPKTYRTYDSEKVASFAASHPQRIQYFQYLQFLVDEQLRAVGDESIRLGMPVGLYMDVAVGANLSGADLWCDQALYVLGASVGCPPDAFNQLGQNWGLPPIHPARLREFGYEPFIRMIRANMKYAGALRIDHALALFRIFWIPEGENGTNGAYLRFQPDELLGILALESHRNGCIVIGEDLGTIPDYVKDGLAGWGALSYKVFFFEKDSDTALTPPANYPWLSLVTVSTHDLPTLAGFWEGADLTLRQLLDQFPTDAQYQEAVAARPGEKAAIVNSLVTAGLLPEGSAGHWLQSAQVPAEVVEAVHRYLARTPARLQAVQLEDLLGLTTQMNLPGTTTEHPNWRRRLPVALEQLSEQPLLRQILHGLRQESGKAVRPSCCG